MSRKDLSLRAIFGVPAVLFVLTLTGLIGALLEDGLWDILGAALLTAWLIVLGAMLLWGFVRRQMQLVRSGKPPLVHVEVFSIRRRWSTQLNLRWSLRISAPGSRWDSQRIWKPLQMPMTGIPRPAASITSVITGEKREMAPQRR